MSWWKDLKLKVRIYHEWNQVAVITLPQMMSDEEILELVNSRWNKVKKVKASFIKERL